VDRPKVAIIERTGETCAPEQAALHRELWNLGWQAESVDPQHVDARFNPQMYQLVVNRLSATAYDVDSDEPVFVRARNWLVQAERDLGAKKVWNGENALLVDSSKLRQQALFDRHGVGPRTQSFSTLDAVRTADGSEFGDRPVFLKLVAGGSGKGTLPFPSFAALQLAIKAGVFPNTDGESDFPKIQQAVERLRKNLQVLHPNDPPNTVIVQEAIDFDPHVEVYQRFLNLVPTPPLDRSRWVLRVECWDGAFSFGAWMATTGTNYCHAQGCDIHRPQSVIRLADIEWIREKAKLGREGRWLAIDINGLSIMRTLYKQGVWEVKNGSEERFEGDSSGEFLPWRRLAERLVRD
jgi:hypothetical protein